MAQIFAVESSSQMTEHCLKNICAHLRNLRPNWSPFLRAAIVAIALTPFFAAVSLAQVTWNIDNTTNIGGNAVTTVKGSPTVVSTPFGNALRFDGDDGIIVNADPVAGAANFTVEMLFRPDPIVRTDVDTSVPRILHLQSAIPPDHRATLEGRIVGSNWYLDAFLRSQTAGQGNPNATSNLTLMDSTKLHPLSQWYNFTMTYDGAQLKAYLNGQLELAGNLAVQAMAAGQTSLGMRINQINHFEGIIAKVRFTSSVVDPANFMSAVIPGDYDRNGTVNAADYDTWKAAFGTTVAALGDGADGNGDGVVNAADYTVWRDHAPAGSAASLNASVPEPAMTVLIVTAILALLPARAWRKS